MEEDVGGLNRSPHPGAAQCPCDRSRDHGARNRGAPARPQVLHEYPTLCRCGALASQVLDNRPPRPPGKRQEGAAAGLARAQREDGATPVDVLEVNLGHFPGSKAQRRQAEDNRAIPPSAGCARQRSGEDPPELLVAQTLWQRREAPKSDRGNRRFEALIHETLHAQEPEERPQCGAHRLHRARRKPTAHVRYEAHDVGRNEPPRVNRVLAEGGATEVARQNGVSVECRGTQAARMALECLERLHQRIEGGRFRGRHQELLSGQGPQGASGIC